MKTYVLYGVSARDKHEHVCMFFDKKKEGRKFAAALPGEYSIITLKGIDYKALTIMGVERVS